jgi:hemoglobin
LLGPVFVDIAHLDLAVHLPVMCDFWQTVLFRSGTYRRNALQPHMHLSERAHLTPAHFARWLRLWCATVDERHVGDGRPRQVAGDPHRRRDEPPHHRPDAAGG